MTTGTENAAVTHNEVDDFLHFDKPQMPPVNPEQEWFDGLCYRALEQNEDGKALMAELLKSLQRPSWMPGQDKDSCIFAEGEKNLIRFLDHCIKRFKLPKGA